MKKLTAGIFTALLGLVTVNAANAAIPSTNYVNEHIDAVRSRIDNVETAYKAADTALGGRVTELETTVGEGTMSVNGNEQNDVIAAINALDAKTNGIATNTALETLQNTVSGHTTDISGLKSRMDTAEGEIDTLQSEMDAVEAKAAANESAITVLKGSETTEGSVAKSVADAKAFVLQEASDMAGMAKSDAKKYTDDEISALTTTVNGKASQADLDTAESAIADNAAAILLKASQADLDTVSGRVDTAEDDIEALETKTAGLKSLAYQDIIDNSDITDGTIDQAKITNLTTDLAAKVDDSQVIAEAGTVTNADAEIPTIARMDAALAAKMPLTTTDTANIGEDGTYVLTATTEGGVTTYKWEQIERSTPK